MKTLNSVETYDQENQRGFKDKTKQISIEFIQVGDTEEDQVISGQEVGCRHSDIAQPVSTMHSETKLVITSECPRLCKDFPV